MPRSTFGVDLGWIHHFADACDRETKRFQGRLLDDLPESDIPTYVETMKRLRELPVEVVHGGHDESFGRERLIEIADDYVASRG